MCGSWFDQVALVVGWGTIILAAWAIVGIPVALIASRRLRRNQPPH